MANVPYTAYLHTADGRPGTWSLDPYSDPLPDGISLDPATGIISGVVTTTETTHGTNAAPMVQFTDTLGRISSTKYLGWLTFYPDNGLYRKQWSKISAGAYNTCGISGGTLYRWGRGTWMLGRGKQPGMATTYDARTSVDTAVDVSVPTYLGWYPPGSSVGPEGYTLDSNNFTVGPEGYPMAFAGWSDVSVSDDHVCAVRSVGTLWCWGYNTAGALGQPTSLDGIADPIQVGNDTDWASVVTGHGITCALRTDASLWCWGGVGWPDPRIREEAPGTRWLSVTAEGNQICGVQMDHTLWCWGKTWAVALDPGSSTPFLRVNPAQVGTDSGWQSVSLNGTNLCATRSTGSLWCWPPDPANSQEPTQADQVGNGSDWESIEASIGAASFCGLRGAGTVWCFDATSSGWDVPTQPNVDTFTTITQGEDYTCGIKSDGTGWCWEPDWRFQTLDPDSWRAGDWDGSNGRLGSGMLEGAPYPAPIS